MKLLRYAMFYSFFSIIEKNKKNALTLINIGIFLTFFAISASVISFFIESKISKKQEELMYLQIETQGSSKTLSDIEIYLGIFENSWTSEDNQRVYLEFQSLIELGDRNISSKDFYYPYIFSNLYELTFIEYFEKQGIDLADKNNEIYKFMIETVEGVWNENEVTKVKKSIFSFTEQYQIIKKKNLNHDEFKLEKIPSINEIKEEILDTRNSIWEESSHSTIYFDLMQLNLKLLEFMRQMTKIMKAMQGYNLEKINLINIDIISLSNNEKNIILITFILQFLVFLIIQFFEITSLQINFKKKTKIL